ncbi:MAG TPA: methionyl-tRNA formyltransferase [Solirubrobacteraceae bacterium]|jgi:methionyl-tRNA formyltransferase|nr:methionyl-tRNA formyltransferase [Solirubrobacteraceae bacterium]
MRIVYLGTSAFAAAVLEGLLAAGMAPVLVVTRPDRPRGRGRKLASPPVAELARRRELDLLAPPDVNAPDAVQAMLESAPEAICVCAFGAMIREPLLSMRPMLNLHPSLLPRWRGAAPVERAIMAGDAHTGVSIMRVTAGLDSGPVGLSERVTIEADDTYGTLSGRLQAVGVRLLLRALREAPSFAEQDERLATYAEKIGPEDRRLDPAREAGALERVVRALEPHIGARLDRGVHGWLRVRAARAVGEPAPAPGVLEARDGRLLLGCDPGALELVRVQPAGGQTMSGGDYARGHGSALG